MKVDLEQIRAGADAMIQHYAFDQLHAILRAVIRAVPQLVAEIRRLQAIEAAALCVEWVENYEWTGAYCPMCDAEKSDGHDPECLLGRALALKGCLA